VRWAIAGAEEARGAVLREEEIRPRALMEAKRVRVEADRRYLLDRRDRWVRVACPACGMDAPEAFGEKGGFAYARCAEGRGGCGTVYTNPRPDAGLLCEFYANSENYAYWNEHVFPATEGARRERIFRPRAERVARLIERLGVRCDAFVEVGAGFGTFCAEIERLGVAGRIVAVEPTAGCALTCRGRGFETIEDVVERVELEGEADVVAAFEVIEHLFDPGAFVARCASFLRPGGVLVVSCPNVRGFDVGTLGLASGTFDHEHLNYFHPASLAGLIEGRGLEVVEVSTPGQMDADLVKGKVDAGEIDVSGDALMEEVFVRRWEELAGAFQRFLSENRLSGHLWVAARKVG